MSKQESKLKIDRLLGQEVFIDIKKFHQYIGLFKQVNISLNYSLEKPTMIPFDSYWHARTIVSLLAKDQPIYIPNPNEFIDLIIEYSLDIEASVLDVLFYEYNSDDGEFMSMSTEEKIQDFISSLDTHSAQCFMNYIQDRNLFRLIEQYFGDWHFDE